MKPFLSRVTVLGLGVTAAVGLSSTGAGATIQPPHRRFQGFGTSEAAAYDNAVANAAAASYGSCTETSASDPHPGYWTVTVSCVQQLN